MTTRGRVNRTFVQPLRVRELSARGNHSAVCAVLRCAARVKADVADAGMVCDALGLDLKAALNRAGNGGTPSP